MEARAVLQQLPSCGTNAGSQLKLANGVDVGTANGGAGDQSLWVNGGFVSSQTSDFAIAEVLVWPRGLTDQEMRSVSQHLSGLTNGLGASVLQINIMAPRSGNYQVRLTQRRGSEEATNKKFDCRSKNKGAEKTDSFFICASDPRSSATNPDPGIPDTSSCKTYHYAPNSAHTFSLSQGGNSLWLASREVQVRSARLQVRSRLNLSHLDRHHPHHPHHPHLLRSVGSCAASAASAVALRK